MSADDDTDCSAHVWGLAEVRLLPGGAETVQVCDRCGAVTYGEDKPGQDARRPRL